MMVKSTISSWVLGAAILSVVAGLSPAGARTGPCYLKDVLNLGFHDLETEWMVANGIDICSTDQQNEIKIDLPGIDKSTLIIKVVQNHVLSIEGKKKEASGNGQNKQCRIRGRSWGAIRQEFSVDFSMDAKAAKAWYEDGVLTIVFPKGDAQEEKASQIRLSAAPVVPQEGVGPDNKK